MGRRARHLVAAARPGAARRGPARRGPARRGPARPGAARPGAARRGPARRGAARRGLAQRGADRGAPAPHLGQLYRQAQASTTVARRWWLRWDGALTQHLIGSGPSGSR
ncbi:hypothetical protein [Micromonospora sp. DT68]|uniref:hypothetical protein n=1 Tax=unclassified Micromonospora TaxID=2617518 RepID=UPI003CF93710